MSPQFWTGHTGKALRDRGAIVQLVAVYLMTSPHSHMCGLYYLPTQYIAYETGQPLKAIQKALDVLQNEGFAFYDSGTEFVWVKEMSHWQIGPMKNGDKRQPGIERWYNELPPNPFLGVFFDRYSTELGLSSRRSLSPIEAPSEGHLQGLKSPTYPYLSPVLDPVLEESARETKKPRGEFGHAKLTDGEMDKLDEKLGDAREEYIARFDGWVHQAPTAKHNGVKRCDREAYSSICQWFDRDVKEGKQSRASPQLTDDQMAARAKEIFGKAARVGK